MAHTPSRDRRAPRAATDGFELGRLRAPEWVMGASALALLVTMFLPWFGARAELQNTLATLQNGTTSFSGWGSFTVGDVFIAACVLYGLAAWFFQAYSRAPALPVVLTVLLTPTSLLTALIVLHRVVISKPESGDLVSLRPAAIVGLVAVLTLFAAAYASLRRDGIREVDGPGEIETFRRRRGPVRAS